MASMQILLLLALYSLFDPQSPPTWSIVGILTRQITTQGLNYNVISVNDAASWGVEFRRRLFWSTFILDRMMAVSVGQAPGFVGEHSDVPLPAVTIEEFASPGRARFASVLQTNRHIIELRRLEGEIMTAIHLRSPVDMTNLTVAARSAIIRQLRTEIENWYSSGSLISKPQPDNVPIHSTITWMNARYYHLLILLHYPCPFNAYSQDTSFADLQKYARKSIQYNRVLFTYRQLPLNLITLNRLIITCLVLVYCFASDSPVHFHANDEVQQCITLLQAFPERWTYAHQLAALMAEFTTLLLASQSPHFTMLQNSSLAMASGQPPNKAWLLSLQQQLIELLRGALCKSTCYQHIFNWMEQNPSDTGSVSTDIAGEVVVQETQMGSTQIEFMFL